MTVSPTSTPRPIDMSDASEGDFAVEADRGRIPGRAPSPGPNQAASGNSMAATSAVRGCNGPARIPRAQTGMSHRAEVQSPRVLTRIFEERISAPVKTTSDKVEKHAGTGGTDGNEEFKES